MRENLAPSAATTRRAWLASALVTLAGCGGGGGAAPAGAPPAAASPAAPTPSSPPSPPPSAPPPTPGGASPSAAVRAALATGTHWEFLVTRQQSSVSASGSDSTQDWGLVRWTLGAPRQVAGVAGHELRIEGDTAGAARWLVPPWRFIALDGARWVASSDDTTLVTVYDPAMPGSSTGFFIGTGSARVLTATRSHFEGAYNRFEGIGLGASSSDGGCRWVFDEQVCMATTTSVSQQELLVDGIGPAGFRFSAGYLSGDPAVGVAVRQRLTVELVGTSLAARDGTPVRPPPWSPALPLPAARERAVAVTLGTRVYVFGGIGATADFDARRVDRFESLLGGWQRLPDAPRSLLGWQGTVVGSRIGLFGGSDGFLFEPVNGRWTATARRLDSGQVTGVGTRVRSDGRTEVLAIVDRGSAFLQATLVRYWPDQDRWETLGSFDRGPLERYEALLVGNRFLIIGGRSGTDFVPSVRALDVDTREIRPLGQLAEGVAEPAVALHGGRVIVAGGVNHGGYRPQVHWIDPVAGAVTAGPALLGGVKGAAAASVQGAVLVMGGRDGRTTAPAVATVWRHRP